jgi:hypothetical protein
MGGNAAFGLPKSAFKAFPMPDEVEAVVMRDAAPPRHWPPPTAGSNEVTRHVLARNRPTGRNLQGLANSGGIKSQIFVRRGMGTKGHRWIPGSAVVSASPPNARVAAASQY